MPLPNHQLTLSGACRCNSILFEIDIPSYKTRPTENKSNQRLPLILPTTNRHTHVGKTNVLLIHSSQLTVSFPPTTPPPTTIQPHTFLPLLDPKPTIPPKPAREWKSIMPMLQDANLQCSCLTIKTVDSKSKVSCSRCGTKLFVPLNDEIMELPIKILVTEGLREEHQEWLLPERGLQWDGKSIIVEERIADRGADEGVLKDYGKARSEGIYGRVGA